MNFEILTTTQKCCMCTLRISAGDRAVICRVEDNRQRTRWSGRAPRPAYWHVSCWNDEAMRISMERSKRDVEIAEEIERRKAGAA